MALGQCDSGSTGPALSGGGPESDYSDNFGDALNRLLCAGRLAVDPEALLPTVELGYCDPGFCSGCSRVFKGAKGLRTHLARSKCLQLRTADVTPAGETVTGSQD